MAQTGDLRGRKRRVKRQRQSADSESAAAAQTNNFCISEDGSVDVRERDRRDRRGRGGGLDLLRLTTSWHVAASATTRCERTRPAAHNASPRERRRRGRAD